MEAAAAAVRGLSAGVTNRRVATLNTITSGQLSRTESPAHGYELCILFRSPAVDLCGQIMYSERWSHKAYKGLGADVASDASAASLTRGTIAEADGRR